MPVKPTVLQQIFASKWPGRIWFLTMATLVAVTFLRESGLLGGEFSDMQAWFWAGVITLLGAALGAVLGIFPGMLIIAPIFFARGRLNGAPFSEGDVVQILTGPYRGRIAKVYSKWQGDSVRVNVGSEAAETYQDVFFPTEIFRVPEVAMAEEQCKTLEE